MEKFLLVPVVAWLAAGCFKYHLLQRKPRLEEELPFLAQTLAALPRRVLTPKEREEFARTGVVYVPGVLPNVDLVDYLAWKIGELQPQADQEELHKAWTFHGPLRALVREELFAGLALSAEGAKLGEGGRWAALEEAPPEAAAGYYLGGTSVDLYHTADRLHIQRPHPLVSVWLSLNDAVEPMEFVRGSHQVISKVHADCGIPWGGGASGFEVYHTQCLNGLRDHLVNATGGAEPFFTANMSKGDAFVFSGYVLHRKLEQALPRLAVAMRYSPLDGLIGDRAPPSGTHYMFPRGPDQPDLVPWQLFPSLGPLSPLLRPESRGRAALSWLA